MTTEIGILFKWENVKADVGEFRQDSDLLSVVKVTDAQGDVYVMVRVPFEKEYWDNYEAVAQGQMAAEKVTPILTPAGMAYAKHKLEEPFKTAMVKATEESWGTAVEKEVQLNGNPTSIWQGWGSEAVTSTPVPAAEATTPETKEDWGKAPWDAGRPQTEEKWTEDWKEEK